MDRKVAVSSKAMPMEIVFYSAKNFNIFLSLFQQISTVYWIKTEIKIIKLSKYYTRQKILIMHVISLRNPSTPSKSKKLITRDILLTSDFPKVKKYGSPSICDNQFSITNLCRNPGNNHTPLDTSSIPIGNLT